MAQGFQGSIKTLKADNLEGMQDFLDIIEAQTVVTASVSVSTDPFSGKTNKFAEFAGMVITATADFHFKVGPSNISDVDTSDMLWRASRELKLSVDPDRAFLRLIPATGSATFHVAEVGTNDQL